MKKFIVDHVNYIIKCKYSSQFFWLKNKKSDSKNSYSNNPRILDFSLLVLPHETLLLPTQFIKLYQFRSGRDILKTLVEDFHFKDDEIWTQSNHSC